MSSSAAEVEDLIAVVEVVAESAKSMIPTTFHGVNRCITVVGSISTEMYNDIISFSKFLSGNIYKNL